MIQTPIGWLGDQLDRTRHFIASDTDEAYWHTTRPAAPPTVRRIGLADISQALRRGAADLAETRTDVIFICLLYPLVGLLLAALASNSGRLPLVFPLMAGFALLGPAAAIWLMEMSRRREQGEAVTWVSVLGFLRSPSLGAIVALSGVLLSVFVLWLIAANAIYLVTLGPEPPADVLSFLTAIVTTRQGWTMALVGSGVDILFAMLVLSISVVSFPLLLDRNVGMAVAIQTSLRAVAMNPVPMAAWGLTVGAALVLGSLPLLMGLVVVVPLLGHATWHLYRAVIDPR